MIKRALKGSWLGKANSMNEPHRMKLKLMT